MNRKGRPSYQTLSLCECLGGSIVWRKALAPIHPEQPPDLSRKPLWPALLILCRWGVICSTLSLAGPICLVLARHKLSADDALRGSTVLVLARFCRLTPDWIQLCQLSSSKLKTGPWPRAAGSSRPSWRCGCCLHIARCSSCSTSGSSRSVLLVMPADRTFNRGWQFRLWGNFSL